MDTLAWILQGLLAFTFLIAGFIKATQSKVFIKEKLGPWADDFPLGLIKMLGLTQILTALGLVLPMLMNKYTNLTPIAAGVLMFIMVGAVFTHFKRKEYKEMLPPTIMLIMAGVIAFVRQGLLF